VIFKWDKCKLKFTGPLGKWISNFFLACTTGTCYELVISMQVTRPPIKYLVEQELKDFRVSSVYFELVTMAGERNRAFAPTGINSRFHFVAPLHLEKRCGFFNVPD